MEVKITTLSENTANYGFMAEWGLSMLIEVDGKKILLDTALSFSAVHNAQLLGIDLSEIDCIVLSHGHADHTGGLREVLRRSGPKEIYAHPDIWTKKYVNRHGERERFIGIPFAREELEALGGSFKLSREPVKLSEHIMTTGEVPMVTEYESIEPVMFVKEQGKTTPDVLADDLSLVIDADFGLVVVLGCGHHGIVNTLQHARKLTGNETVYAVIGGPHLIGAAPERLSLTVAALREMGVQKIGLSHCTGFAASVYLAQEMGDAYFLNNAGSRIKLPF
ncbi:MAG: MBL fold metallo-hydrolase [Dehalococcoidales bacterium]|nr:MBL fold metallo-hydrolase [Dehalococcoidales bacterium]